MRKFFITFLIFAFLAPAVTAAQTAQATEESLLRARVQLLQLQLEILRTQLAILLRMPQSSATNCAQLQVSWERVSGADSYRLYRDGLLVYKGRDREFIDSGLMPGRKYRYSVSGLFRGEQGQASEIKEITAPNACPPSTPLLNFKAEPCGGKITLSWSRSQGAATYQVFRDNREIYQGPLLGFVDSNLRPGNSYEYKIRAGSSGGWSGFSPSVNFAASALCAPSAPEVSSAVPEAETEGIMLVEMNSFPGNNVSVKTGTDIRSTGRPRTVRSINRSIMAFSVEAKRSDITITRVDLFFDFPPWPYLDKVGLRYGGRTLAEKEATQQAFSRMGSEHLYQLRLDGFSAVVKEDRSGTFSVIVDGREFASGSRPRDIKVWLENNSVRGIDKAGIFHLAPVSGGGKEGSFSRTFRVE